MRNGLWKIARFSVVLSIVAVGAAGATTGYADPDNEKKKSEIAELERSQREDHETAGQVLAIDSLKDPPEIRIGTLDGEATIKVMKKDEIARNGIRVGDHISAIGEKVSEAQFLASELRVDPIEESDDDE